MIDDQDGVPTRPVQPRKQPSALIGGLIGSLLTLALLVVLIPSLSPWIVRQGLMRDPQMLNDAVGALQQAQYAPVLDAHRAALETPFASSWKGASKPDVTVVEFFDYACPYCKASNAAVDKLAAEDPKVRIVYREFPILGPDSVAAARLSLAASKAGRFTPFHDALWSAGKPSPDTLGRASTAAGITPDAPSDPAIEQELKNNYQLASQLGANGTPVFIIGDKVLNGAVDYDALKSAVAEARARS